MPAREGRPYFAAATGAFSRKVVGLSMSGRITEKVAIDAIEQAVGREGPPDDGGLVSHGGQGARCASRSFRRCLGSHGTAQSASRPGTPPDSAAAEPFSETLKGESVEGRSHGARARPSGASSSTWSPIAIGRACIPPWTACLRWNTSGNTLEGP